MAFRFHSQGALNVIEDNEEREKERKDRLLTISGTALKSYLENKNNRQSTSAEKAVLLKQISDLLPEDSAVVSQLSGASVETLTDLSKAIKSNFDSYDEASLTYTPEMLESDLNLTRVEVENNPDVDLAEFYKNMYELSDADLDSEVAGGLTLRNLLNEPEQSDVGLAFRIKKPPASIDPSKQTAFRNLLPDLLAPVISSEKSQVDSQIANAAGDIPSDLSDRADVLEQAQEALKNKDYTKAIEIAGPELAIQIMETNPSYRQFAFMINSGLSFPDNDIGDNLLTRAIKSGLLKEGDTYMLGTQTKMVTEEMVNLVIGG